MNCAEFLEKLKSSGLLTSKVIEQLRAEVAGDRDAEVLGGLLVQRGLLSESQVARMLAPPDEDDLELMLLDDDDQADAVAEPPSPAGDADDQAHQPVVVLDDADLVGAHDDLIDMNAGADRQPAVDAEADADEAPWATPLQEVDLSEPHRSYVPRQRSRGLGGIWQSLGGGRRPSNSWDSPLILWGGGGLLLLLGALVFLVVFLVRGSGNELLAKADEQYRSQQYLNAIESYSDFIDRYSSHEQASHARVKLRLAQIRQTVDIERDWPKALRTAQAVLPELQGEAALSEAQDELSGLLPAILEGLAQRAEQADSIEQARQLVAQADETMQLIDNPNYLPSTKRQGRQAAIAQTLARLSAVRRLIDQDQQQQQAIEQMQQLAEQGELQKAYQVGRQFVGRYPSSVGHPDFVEAFQGLAKFESQAITTLPISWTPVAGPAPGSDLREVLVFHAQGEPISQLSTQPVLPVLIRGAIYGVQAASGQVLWRYFVGAETTVFPRRLRGPETDVLAVDATHRQLMRISASDGSLKWRLPCPSDPLAPVASDEHAYVACRDGELLKVALADGTVQAAVRLPLPLSGGVAWDADSQSVLVPAVYASLYELNADSLDAKRVVSLGHLAGAVAEAPVAAGGVAAIAENLDAGRCRLHLISVAKSADDKFTLQPVELPGQVLTPLQVDGTRVLAITDTGAVSVVDLQPAGAGSTPRQLATNTSVRSIDVLPYATLREGHVWVLSDQLKQFQLVAAQGRLADQSSLLADVAPLGPLQLIGDYLFAAVQAKRRPQATVVAARIDRQGTSNMLWRTDLALPPVEPLWKSAQPVAIDLVTRNGDWYRIDAQAIHAGRQDQPLAQLQRPGTDVWFDKGAPLRDNLAVYLDRNRSDRLYLAAPGQSPLLRAVTLDLDGQPIRGLPAAANGGLLVPSSHAIHWLDAGTGERVGVPYAPALQPGQDQHWTNLVQLDGAGRVFAVGDQAGRLYQLELSDQPQPHVQLVKQTELQSPLSERLAFTGETMFALTSATPQPAVIGVAADSLKLIGSWSLDQPAAWGPAPLGPYVALLQQDGTIWFWSGRGELVGQVKTGAGAPVGTPLWRDKEALVAFVSGKLAWVDPVSQQVVEQLDAGEPIGGGPVLLANYIVVVAADGTLRAIPSSRAE